MNDKRVVIEKYADVTKLYKNEEIVAVYFKKYLSKGLLKTVLLKCPSIKKIYLSKSALRRCSKNLLDNLKRKGIEVFIVNRVSGRPSLLEKDMNLMMLPHYYVPYTG
ncbi:MAG: hypothetical protein ACP6IU_14540 [Candidatus Asgardarchaeia archaeon]